jgi:LysR family transcriptional regulator, nitrogen assimilation regulatory protein
MTVGELVRTARGRRSQKEFADLLGVEQSSVSRYESGKASPPVSVIDACMHLVHSDGDASSPTIGNPASPHTPVSSLSETEPAVFAPGSMGTGTTPTLSDQAVDSQAAQRRDSRRDLAAAPQRANLLPREGRIAAPRLSDKEPTITILDARWSVFSSVALAGSFSRAASALDMPQSMVSRNVAQLEQQCGERLFRRTGRGVVLTEFGEQMLPKVNQLTAAAEALADDIRSVRGQPAGEVRVGLLPSAVKMFAGAIVSATRQKFPGVRLHMTEAASAQLEEHLREGRLDMATVLREDKASIGDAQMLARVPLHLIGRSEDPLFDNPDVELAALSGLPLVIPSRPHLLRARLDRLAVEHSLDLAVAVEADSVSLQCAVALVGGGYAIASALPGQLSVGLASARIVNPMLERFVVLVESPQRPHTRATEGVKHLICQVAESLARH